MESRTGIQVESSNVRSSILAVLLTTHLFLLMTYVLKCGPRPLNTLNVGSMYVIRVGSEETHSVAPEGALLFTLDLTSPNLRNTVSPPFFKSEQGTTYGNGLREDPRDP